MKKYIDMLFEDETNKKINNMIGIIYIFLLFVIFPLIIELTGIGRYSIKTTYYLLTTIITFSLFFIFNIKRIVRHKYNWIDFILIAYALVITLSTYFSEYRKEILIEYPPCRGEGIVTLFAYILTFYIVSKTFFRNKIIENIIKVVTIIVSAFGIVQAIIGRYYGFGFDVISTIEDAEYMACATMLNPNFFSSYINIFLPIYLIYYLLDNSKCNFVIIGIMFAALVCTKTSGGYITFGLVFCIICVYSLIVQKNKRKILLKILLLVISFLIIFILLNMVNDNKYYEEFVQIEKEKDNLIKGDESFGNNRLYIWKMTINVIKDYPILGVGPDSFGREIIKNYMNKDNYLFGDTLIDKAHSEYLQIAVTTGIVSLVIYLIFIFIICISLIKKYVYYVKNKEVSKSECIFLVAISASLFSYLFQASANISVTCVAPIFWCVLGIGYSIGKEKS